MGIIDGLKMIIMGKPKQQEGKDDKQNENSQHYTDPWNSDSPMP